MEKKIVPYGETHSVTVISATAALLAVVSEQSGEGYMLMGHETKPLPNKDDKGWIRFEKVGPMRGYWKYYAENPKYI